MSLAAAVRKLRKARDWTLTELERRTIDPDTGTRIHAGTIGNIERGKHRNPTERTIRRLAAAFEISVPELRREAGLDTPPLAPGEPEQREALELLQILQALPPDERAAIIQIVKGLGRRVLPP